MMSGTLRIGNIGASGLRLGLSLVRSVQSEGASTLQVECASVQGIPCFRRESGAAQAGHFQRCCYSLKWIP